MISYRSSLKGAGNGSGDSGHTITDGITLYTQRSVLRFDSPLTVQDDLENEATKVGVETGAVVDFSEFELPSSLGNQSGQNNNSLHQYSTEEQIVGTWTDGRPVYEKVLSGSMANFSSEYSVAHGISNMLDVVDLFCICKGGTSDEYQRPLPFAYYSTSTWDGAVSANETYIYFQLGSHFLSGYSSGNYIVKIQYTKTTDTPTNQ